MNLIENDPPQSPIFNFRKDQYKLIPDLITYGINYLIDLGLEYDPNYYSLDGSKIDIITDNSYINYNHFDCSHIIIKLFPNIQYFTYFSVPNLIQNMFFKLNGNFYIPKIYIADEPCVVKENSSTFYSLFTPLSMYFSEKRFTFIGTNFKLNEFLSILIDDTWEDELIENILERWDLTHAKIKYNDEILEFFSEKLNTDPEINKIRDKLNQLFFDPWTSELYKHYYNYKNPNLSLILKNTIINILNNNISNFIDLKHKRLVWIEYILRPYFRAISSGAIHMLKKNSKQKLRVLKLNINAIVEHFYSKDGLNGNEFYNSTNGFSGLGLYKASIMNPFGSGEPPSEMASIHPTYKNRICPCSVSNKDTGKELFLVPDQEIDSKFGLFKF